MSGQPRPKGISLDDLKEKMRQVSVLIEDQQPGLISWNFLLHDALKALHETLDNGRGALR